jgi:hypothetical protein
MFFIIIIIIKMNIMIDIWSLQVGGELVRLAVVTLGNFVGGEDPSLGDRVRGAGAVAALKCLVQRTTHAVGTTIP